MRTNRPGISIAETERRSCSFYPTYIGAVRQSVWSHMMTDLLGQPTAPFIFLTAGLSKMRKMLRKRLAKGKKCGAGAPPAAPQRTTGEDARFTMAALHKNIAIGGAVLAAALANRRPILIATPLYQSRTWCTSRTSQTRPVGGWAPWKEYICRARRREPQDRTECSVSSLSDLP